MVVALGSRGNLDCGLPGRGPYHNTRTPTNNSLHRCSYSNAGDDGYSHSDANSSLLGRSNDHSDVNTISNCHTNADHCTNPNVYTDGHGFSHACPFFYSHSHAYSNAHAHFYPDAYFPTNSYAFTDANPHNRPHTYPYTQPRRSVQRSFVRYPCTQRVF